MASEPKGNGSATRLHRMSADYGIRAATALNTLLPGQHRAKAIQRLFDVSPRTAKYLLAGRFWTIQRLTQARSILGAPFDAALLSDELHLSEMQEITERLARLESWREELRQPEGPNASDLSPARGEAADGIGGEGAAGTAGEPDRGGSAAPGQGHLLARTGR